MQTRHVVSAGAVVKKSIAWAAAVLVLGAAGARADELDTPPSFVISGSTNSQYWTGFYFGANGGYGWANSAESFTANDAASLAGTCGGAGHPAGQCIPSTDYHMDGAQAGGQLGYNWQINSQWMTGVEADYQWSDFNGQGTSTFRLGGVGSTTANVNEEVKSFGTFRGRMGVMPVNWMLLYGTAGFAYGRVSESSAIPGVATGSETSGGFSYRCTSGSSCFAGSSTDTVLGWTAGAGIELALTRNLTFRTETLYVHMDAPTGTSVAQGTTTTGPTPSSFAIGFAPVRFVVARAGLNFKF